MSLGRFLVVEDHETVAQGIARMLERHRPVVVEGTVASACLRVEADGPWTGVVLDIGLPDGTGLDVLRAARRSRPFLPVLVLTARLDAATVNKSHELRAEFACKPLGTADIVGFARRAVAFERVTDERVARVVDRTAQEAQLSAREADIAAACTARVDRTLLAEQLGISTNTLKSHVRTLLRKTGHESLAALCESILRKALDGAEAERAIALLGDQLD